MQRSDTDYKILKILEGNPNLTQRQIAKKLNLSLGKTNYVIRALIDSGWVKLNNFKRSDHKIGYIYLLTPLVKVTLEVGIPANHKILYIYSIHSCRFQNIH